MGNTSNKKYSRFNLITKLLPGLVVLGLLGRTEVFAQNFWQQSSGPYVGDIRTLAINVSGHVFAGTNGGVFRSTDNGKSWMPVNIGLTSIPVNALVINSSGDIFAGADVRVFRSTNNGESWTLVYNGSTNAVVQSLAINGSGHIFAGTIRGVFRSTDNGGNWVPVNIGLTIPVIYSLAINSSGHIFAGTDESFVGYGGVFRSTDNGESWTPVNIGVTNGAVRSLAINSSGHIFAGTYGGGVFRSTDNGESWTLVNTGLMNTIVLSLVIDPNGYVLAGTNSWIFHSTNNGENWTQSNAGPLAIISVQTLAINSSGHIFAGTSRYGVFRSTNNRESWMPVNTVNISLTNAAVRSLVINSNGHIFAGTRPHDIFGGNSGDGVFRSTDNGESWMPVNIGLTSTTVNALAINSKGYIFAGGSRGGVFRSINNGESWMPVNSGLTGAAVNALAVNSRGHVFVGIDRGGIFRSTNDGESWIPVNAGLTNVDNALSLAINSSGHIFAGINFGVFRSTNNGESWIPVNIGLASNYYVLSLAINSSGHIFAGKGGVFRSTNNGESWIPLNTGLISIQSFVINSIGHIFAGTGGDGVFRSTDNGDAWTTVNAGFKSTITSVESLAISSNGDIFAGTMFGVFRAVSPVVKHTPPSSSQELGREISIDANIYSNTGIKNAALSYHKGGDAKFMAVQMLKEKDDYKITIPADLVTSRGVEYFIIATDSTSQIKKEPSSGFFSVQVHISGNGEMKRDAQERPVVQPHGGDQNAYRLFAVPLDAEDKSPKAVLEDDLGRYDKKKWRFYALRDDYYKLQAGTSIYTEFPNTEEMAPGKAFWLVVKDSSKVIDTGPAVSNKTDKEYAIALHPGWNFVGNPFNFSIPIDKLRLKSRGNPPTLRFFSGEWNNLVTSRITAILPFEGYAVYDSTSTGDTLFVNPDPSPSSSQLLKSTISQLENILFSIRILAQCQEARDVDNVLMVAESASQNRDDLDQPDPPVIGEYVSVYFPHREWNTLAKTFCIDARPELVEGEVWEFEVKTNIRDKVNLTFEGIGEVPKEFEVWLVDDALKITQNLRESNHYAVAGSEQPKQLKLVVGKHNFVGEKLAGAQLIPMTYELSQNFPNPFNPATTIRYGLPKAERVTLKIYNLLGEEVATLVHDEQKAAGYHAAIWDGRNKNGRVVASGVYVYRLQAGSFVMAKKLALVK